MRVSLATIIVALAVAGSAAGQSGSSGLREADASAISAPPAGAPGIGAPVRGLGGEVFGRVEAIVRDGSGRPVQVVVRSRGIAGVRAQSRAVPVASLRPDGSGWMIPLRRSEFQLLPTMRP